MLRRRHDLAPFIDEDFDAYVAGMRRQHTWGGEPEVICSCLCRICHVQACFCWLLRRDAEANLLTAQMCSCQPSHALLVCCWQVSVAPDVLQRPVDVFSDGRRVGAYEPSAKSAAAKQPVRLLFDGVGHYDLMFERQTASKL